MNYDNAALINNELRHSFDLIINYYRSSTEYKIQDDKIYLIHTEVPKELEGRGIAAELVKKIFDYVEKKGMKVVPVCSYVRHFLKQHPEWNRIVDQQHKNV